MINIVIVLIVVALIICCVLSFKNWKNDKIQPVILVIVTALIGIGGILLNSSTTINIVIPEIGKLTSENSKLKDEINRLNQQIANNDSQMTDKDEELKGLRQSMINNAEFLQYNLYWNNKELNVNVNDSIAKVNGELYFSDDVITAITNEEAKEDNDNKLVYIGKYPEKEVDFLSACEPYDPTDGFILGKSESYKIRGVTYTDGFVLQMYYDQIRNVSFNLSKKYSELTFQIGHVDESGDGIITMIPILDNVPGEAYVFDSNSDPDEIHSIPINNAKELKLQWNGDKDGKNTKYGLINIKIK